MRYCSLVTDRMLGRTIDVNLKATALDGMYSTEQEWYSCLQG